MKKLFLTLAVVSSVIISFGQKGLEYELTGLAKKNAKDYSGALADFNKAIALNPKYSNSFINRGIVKAELKDYQGALADFNQAVKLNPKQSLAYYNRGVVKAELLDYKQAVADFTKAIKCNPKNALAYYYRGTDLIAMNENTSQAQADLKKASELDGNAVVENKLPKSAKQFIEKKQ